MHGSKCNFDVLREGVLMTARMVLGENLSWLMNQRPELSTPAAVEAATMKNNAKVGRSSIDRAKNGVANLTIENLEAIAQVYGRDAWELLRPGLDKAAGAPVQLIGRAKSLDSLLPKLTADDLAGLSSEDLSTLADTIRLRAGELRLLADARAALAARQRKTNGR